MGCLSLFPSLYITRVFSKIVFVYVYGDGNYVYNLPCSYRQPSGRG